MSLLIEENTPQQPVDVTAENILERDHHLPRSKGWDSFCPIGSTINTNVSIDDLKLTTMINGQVFQESTTDNRVLNDCESLSLITSLMTLYPGDIVLTGTPANAENSLVSNGDNVVVEIEKVGKIKNTVRQIREQLSK